MIQIGDSLPDTTLMEYVQTEGEGCSIGRAWSRWRRPAPERPLHCSRCLVPSRPPARHSMFQAMCAMQPAQGRRVDEIWCVGERCLVMGAWAREQATEGVVRMLGMAMPLCQGHGPDAGSERQGLGLRSNRYSMLVRNGKVEQLNVEAPGKFEVSDADTLLRQLKAN